MDSIFGGGVPVFVDASETKRPRTQQETSLLSLINPTLAASLGGPYSHGIQPTTGPAPPKEEEEEEEEDGDDDDDDDDDEEEEYDGDDMDIATDSEEGELDIPKPVAKVLTAAQKKKKQRKQRVLSKDRGDVLYTISPADVQPYESSVTWDQDPELLCSYNWSSTVDNSNTLFVPGGPSKWTPQPIPYTVPGDTGFHPTDYNYVRQPRDPFSPVFHAMTLMNPDYAFNDIDILADRNNLRVLLEFVQGKTVGPFRLDLYMIFGTLVIVRREDGFWRRSDGKSYGFNFEKHFTTSTPDMSDAASHYRAIRYHMGPLNVVCRFEADAYVAGASDVLSESEVNHVAPSASPLMEKDIMERPHFTYRAPFRVLQKGRLIPGHQILELKTQVEKPREDGQSLVSCQDQLWFGRTTHLYTGRYEAGTGKILYIKHEDARERVKRWEEKNQTDLQKLVGLLTMLKGMLMRQQGPLRAAILVREDPRGPITLHEMLDKRNLVQRQFFERHWMKNHRPRQYAQRGGQHGGRGRGGQQRQSQRPRSERSPVQQQQQQQQHRYGEDSGHARLYADAPPRNDAPRRGTGGQRGKGRGSRRGRGGTEQSQN